MIILNNNNNTNVNIPDYDDLVNKPSINGVVLEGNKTTAELGIDIDTTNYYTKREVNERIADSITGIENEFGNYYTKSQSDSKYQPKGNYLTTIPSGYATESWVENKGYLTSIPSEYITETELNDAIAELGGSESVAYLIIKENASDNTFNYVGGSFEDVVNAYNNNKPYFIYVPNGAGVGYYSLAETTVITNTYIQCLSFAHTGVTHTWRYWRLYSDEPILYNQTTYEYATTTQLNSKQNTLVSGENIKTINGQSLLGSGNITIESETTIPTMFIPKGYSGSVDLSILTPIYDAVMNNKPWIVWGDLGAANGRYNMVECSTIGDNTITFYDNSVASDNSISIIRYWTFNITDGTFVMEERNIAYATTTQLNSKQDTLVSGENIKTVNGISLLGGGNITIESVEPDLTGYATETYVSDNYQPKGNYLTSVPSEYVTEIELTNKGYATTTQLNSKQDTLVSGTNIKTINGNSILGNGDITIGSGGTTDLSNYYTKAEIDTKIGDINTILENIIG